MTARYAAADLREFAIAALVAAGASHEAAQVCAEVLVAADLGGIDTHGIARLPQYVQELQRGRVNGHAEPEVVTDSGALVTVDAHNALGAYALRYATDVAIAVARRNGIGAVAVRGSNHAGGISWYTDRAAEAGTLALIFTGSTKAMVTPIDGATPFLGTNAISYAAPTPGGTVSFDAATSIASRSRLEAYRRAGRQLPPGWAVDAAGRPACDPAVVIDGMDGNDGHGLLPMGGDEHGHKGYGLSLLVELLCGPVAGARWGRTALEDRAGVGQFVICMDLGAFGDDADVVAKRIDEMCNQLRDLPAAEGRAVRVPGDRRRDCTADRLRHGICLPEEVTAEIALAATLTGVPAVQPMAGAVPTSPDRLKSAGSHRV